MNRKLVNWKYTTISSEYTFYPIEILYNEYGMVSIHINGLKNLTNEATTTIGVLPTEVPRTRLTKVSNDVSPDFGHIARTFRFTLFHYNGNIEVYAYNGVDVQANVVTNIVYF